MPEMTARKRLQQRWGELKTERSSWLTHWAEISTYLLPRSGRFVVTDRTRGNKRHNAIYDNTGTRSLRILSAGLMGGLTSPARPWFRLGTLDRDLQDQADVKAWLAKCTRIMLDIFARSNTYRALHQSYLELGAFGTSANILLENYQRVIHHYPLTIGEYALAQDWEGRVDTVYREFERSVGETVDYFGRNAVSATVRSLYDRGSYDKMVPIVHAIEPRRNRDSRMRDARNMAWKSCYWESGCNEDKPLRESGFKTFPALCPRWDVTDGDVYGGAPGMDTLGDIKSLQQEQLRKAQGIDYQTNPPLQVPAGVKGQEVERLPGGITYVDAAGGAGKVESLFNVNLDLNHLLADIQDVRERIRGGFYADLFLMLANQTDARMTATEVAERHEEKMLMLGPVLERLHDEMLDPLISRTFDRMLEAGMVPPPPPALRGQELNVELVSMLAQAQRAIATNGVDRFVINLGTIASFKPEVTDKFDADAWADRYSDMLGVDPEMIVPSDKVVLIRQERAQRQAQMEQAAMAEQQASAAQKLATAPTRGGESTALDDVLSQFSGYGGV